MGTFATDLKYLVILSNDLNRVFKILQSGSDFIKLTIKNGIVLLTLYSLNYFQNRLTMFPLQVLFSL